MSIQPNELRIGNWVLGDEIHLHNQNIHSNGYTRITAYGIYMFENSPAIAEKYNPIPLTTEILAVCLPNVTEWFYEGSFKVVADDGYGWCMKVRNASHTREIEFGYFKYLHQLQNLYFSLTGEELNINL